MKHIAMLVLACGTLLNAESQDQPVSLSGYAKALGVRGALADSSQAVLLYLNRVRVQPRVPLSRSVHAEAWLDTEILVSNMLQQTTPPLSWVLLRSGSVEVRQRLFRGFLRAETGRLQLTLGRQRIAWGTGFAWNPTDLLNPFNPGAIELGEREGVSAVHANYALGLNGQVEVVIADRQYATRGGTGLGSYDFHAMIGRFGERTAVGGDLVGYIGGAAWRSEAVWVKDDVRAGYVRAVLNTDFVIPGGVYGLVEVYFNGRNALEPAEVFGRARWYGAVSATTQLSPLIGASVYALANLSDSSALCGPGIQWSLSQGLTLAASMYLFIGAADTEFGTLNHAAFADLTWFF